jgi:hypothetical protein
VVHFFFLTKLLVPYTDIFYLAFDNVRSIPQETAPQEAVVEEKRGRKRGPDRSPLRPSKKPASAAAFIEEGDTSLDTFYYGTLPGNQVIEPEYEIKYSVSN